MKFYFKLALGNIRKNLKLYYSYFISTIFSISLYFIILTIKNSPTLKGHNSFNTFLTLGSGVMIIFSFIFLLYTNSFVIKNRQKEISLYHILGMEKRHIRVMMFTEMFIIACISFLLGIVFGFLLAQILTVLISKLIHIFITFTLVFSFDALWRTVVIFSIIFFISVIYNVMVVIRSNPITLLKNNIGEKEPKTKIFITILGLISLGSGYYLSLSIKDPMQAILTFFIAVILVMIGTYCLFTAGSIALLKFLKRRKNFYYHPNHFTVISGLLYRMKQNAVGLANICILCTCVLVTLSSTICLYHGIDETIAKQCYRDGNLRITANQDVYDDVFNYVSDKVSNLVSFPVYSYTGNFKDGNVELFKYYDYNYLACVNIINLDDYNKSFNDDIELNDNEVCLYSFDNYDKDVISIQDNKYHIKKHLNNRNLLADNSYALNNIAIILNNKQITKLNIDRPAFYLGFDGNNDLVKKILSYVLNNYEYDSCYLDNGYESREMIYDTYGSLLFTGIFLSIMFLLAAIIIIYNKQITEGFEDQNKYEILQNVGMSQHEVKKTIKFQILVFFFTPLIVSIIHLIFAFPLIIKVLKGLSMYNTIAYLISTIGCIIGLILVYSFVYMITSKTYYHIVKK